MEELTCTKYTFPRDAEVQVIDFQTQQQKILPQIAMAYALRTAGKVAAEIYGRSAAKMEGGNLEDLPVVSQMQTKYDLSSFNLLSVGGALFGLIAL